MRHSVATFATVLFLTLAGLLIPHSGAVAQTIWTGPPDVPSQLTAAPDNNSVRLSWSAQPGQRIIAWIYRYTDGSTEKSVTVADRSATTTVVSGLVNGTTYRFQLRAVGQGGTSVWSSWVPATPALQPPASPVGLTSAAGDEQVTLTWSAAGDATITGWELRYTTRAVGWFGATWNAMTGADATTTRHTEGGLVNGETYRFQIRAINAAGAGANSQESQATPPGAPCRITIRNVTAASVGLSFGLQVPGDCGDITNVQYQVKSTTQTWADVDWVALKNPTLRMFPNSSAEQTPAGFEFIAIADQGWHDIRVRAGYENQWGAESVPAWLWVGAPDVPTRIIATPAGQTVLLTWRAARVGQRVTGWEYRYRVAPDSYGSTVHPITDANTPRFSVSGLENGKVHYFQLRAVGDGRSEWSQEVAATPVAATSTRLTTRPGDRQVMLSWPASGNNAIIKWQIRQKADGGSYGNWSDIANSDASTTRHTVTELMNGTTYTFMVQGLISAGPAIISAEQTGTPGVPCQIGAAAESIRAAGGLRVQVELNIPANCGLITNVQYQIKTPAQTWNEVSWTSMGVDLRRFENRGSAFTSDAKETIIPNGQGARQLRVRALNGALEGPPSNAMRIWYSAPGRPDGLVATPGNEAITLSWQAQPDQDLRGWSYRIRAGSGNYGAPIFVSGGETTMVTIDNLTGGTTYGFEVKAQRDTVLSAPAVVEATPWALAVPAQPKGLRAVGANERVTLFWDNLLDPSVDNWQYMQQPDDTGGGWHDMLSTDAATTQYTIYGLTNSTTYTFQIRAVNAIGNGAESAAVEGIPEVEPCQIGIANVRTGANSLTYDLRIPASCGTITDVQYQVKSAAQGWDEVEWTQLDNELLRSFGDHSMPVVTSAVESVQLAADTRGGQDLRVRALNGNAPGPVSEVVSVWLGVPSQPSGVTATVNENTVTLAWSTQSGQNIQRWQYRYKVGDGNWGDNIAVESETLTTVTITGLQVGQPHTFQVRAVGAKGSGPWSSAVTATPSPVLLAAPTDLAGVPGDQEITLSWTAPTGATITGWQLQQRVGSGSYGGWRDMDGSGPRTTEYTVSRLTNGTTYAFKVRAVNTQGAGRASAEVTVTPGAPCRIGVREARGGSTALSFSLRIPPNCGPIDQVQYQVRASTQPWSEVMWQVLSQVDLQRFDDSSVETLPTARQQVVLSERQGLVDIRVRAINGTAPGVASEIAAVWIGAPNMPAGLTVTPQLGAIRLNWQAPAEQAIFAWEYRYKSGADGTYGAPITVSGGTTTAVTVPELSIGVTYTFQLRAIGWVQSDWSAEVSATPRATARQSINFMVSAGDRQLTLTWNHRSAPNIAKWQLQQRFGDPIQSAYDEWSDIAATHAATGTLRIGDLINGIQYVYRIRSVNTEGEVIDTSPERWNTPSRPQPPGKPTGLQLTLGVGEVHLSWDNPQNESITQWQYRMNVNNEGFEDWTTIANSAADTTSTTIGGLRKDSTHAFELRAVNRGGHSEESDSVEVSNPARPTGVLLVVKGEQIELTWNDPEDATITQWQYRLKVDDATTFGNWMTFAGADAETTTGTITGTQVNTTYAAELRAVNWLGASPVSTEVTTVPPTLNRITVETSDSQARMIWVKPHDHATITRWEYQLKEDKGNYGAWTAFAGSGG